MLKTRHRQEDADKSGISKYNSIVVKKQEVFRETNRGRALTLKGLINFKDK